MNNYQLLEVFKFLRRTEIEKCELVEFRFHSVIHQNSHRLPIRLLKAMTVVVEFNNFIKLLNILKTSEYSEEFPQIPLLLSEEFYRCEQKCWNNLKVWGIFPV